MNRRIVGAVLAGVLALGLAGWGQGAVQLPPAKEEIAAMEQAFAQVTRFFGALITELKGAVEALNAVDADLAARYRSAAARLGEAEAKILELQAICANVPGLMTKVDGLASRLEDAWVQIADLRRTAEGLKKADQELAAGIANVVGALEQTRRDLSTAISSLAEKVSALSGQMVSVESRLAALEAYDIRLTEGLAKLTDRVSVLEGVAKDLAGQLGGLGTTVAGLSRQLAEHTARIASLEAQDVASLQRRIIALEQSVQALNIKMENNREKIAALEKAIGGFTADLKASIGEFLVRVEQVEGKLTEFDSKVQADLKAVQDQVALAQGIAIVALLVGIGALVLGLLGG